MTILAENSSIKDLRKLFTGAIRLLLIDDNQVILDVLCNGTFCSPIFISKTVGSFEDARCAIRGAISYHCWILDLTLQRYNDGLDLLKLKPHFPWCVALSGAQSMDDATDAIRAGCYAAFDKKNVFLRHSNKFIAEVCSLSILSFIVNASRPSRFGMFEVLLKKNLRTPKDWSHLYCLNEYDVRKTCMENSGLTAKQLLYFYHALRAIVISDCRKPLVDPNDTACDEIIYDIDFIMECADFVLSHFNSIFGPIYLKQYSPVI